MRALARRQIHRGDDPRPAPRVAARLLQYPGADRQDQAGLLGGGDEVDRANQAALGVVPAQQGLGATHGAGGQVDLGQEAQDELAAVQGAAQRDLGLVAACGARAHALVVDLVHAAAALLGAVHGGVGLAQQRLGVLGALGGQRDPDARTHGERRAQRLGDALGHADRVPLARHVLAQHRELVAAQPRGRVARAQDARETRGDRAQELVAGGMPEGVVDRLEAIEVEEQDGDGRRMPAQPRQRLPEAVEEQRSIRQPRQVVVQNLVGQA